MMISETFRKDHSQLPEPVSRERLLLLRDIIELYWHAHQGDDRWLHAQYVSHQFTKAEFKAYWGWSLRMERN